MFKQLGQLFARRRKSSETSQRTTPAPPVRIAAVESTARRHDMLQHFEAEKHADIMRGYEFCATMQLRTPLRVLLRHGEKHQGIDDPPVISNERWQGIWIPVSKTWRELGLDLPEGPPMAVASEVGPIPRDGGDYLRFLIAVRKVVEGCNTASARRQNLECELSQRRWQPFVRQLGGAHAVADRLIPSFLSTIGLPPAVVRQMKAANLITARGIALAADAQLLAIDGVGPVKLKRIREQCAKSVDPDEEYVDDPAR